MTQTQLQNDLSVIVLAAGKGVRMKSALPKVMHKVAGIPMLKHALLAAEALAPKRIVVVIAPGMDKVAEAAAPHETVVQAEQLGTGHAVSCAMQKLAGTTGDILVIYGDVPLVSPASLRELVSRRAREGAAIAIMGMRPPQPGCYGRLVTSGNGRLEKIVEYLDASPEERAIAFCNSGIMAASGAELPALLAALSPKNAKGEYYLTDCVAAAREKGLFAIAAEGDAAEMGGVNCRADLAAAEKVIQARLRKAAMEAGATLIDPETVHFSLDTRLGRDTTVWPHVVFGPGVSIADNVEIFSFCHIEGASVSEGARVGPFARLRPGSNVGEGAHVGNFVELKNAQLGCGAKANHLTYLGDCSIGAKTNVGAGTITCNYDGYLKHRTTVGENAFIGSNVSLVAPVSIGSGAIIGAGSVITDDIPADALAVARTRQENLADKAPAIRRRKQEEKQRKLAKPPAQG